MNIWAEYYKITGHAPKPVGFSANIWAEYYARTGMIPSLVFEGFNPDIVFDVPPKEALKNITDRGKNLITSERWDDLDSAGHDKAFTVAGVMKADMLQSIYNKIEKAKTEGTTLKDFQKDMLKTIADEGYTELSAGRLKTIYETNMMVSFAKNKYKQQKLSADIFPFWLYTQRQRKTKNKSHAKFHNKVFRHDDSIWSSIYPPSQFGCKCYVTALSESDMKRKGFELSKGDKFKDDIAESDDFGLKILDAWEPDTTKYVDGIKKELDKILKAVPPEEAVVVTPPKKVVDKIKQLTNDEVSDLSKQLIDNDNEELEDFREFHDAKRDQFYDDIAINEPQTNLSLKHYIDEGYIEINDNLRNNRPDENYDNIKKGDLKQVLDEDTILFRGESMNIIDKPFLQTYLDDFVVGNEYKNDALLSTSMRSALGLEFSKMKKETQTSVFFKYKIKKGTKFGYGTDYEQEFMFDTNSTFKINKVEQFLKPNSNNHILIIELEN